MKKHETIIRNTSKPYKNLGDLFDNYWGLMILKVDNSYVLVGRFGASETNTAMVIEEKEGDELAAPETLLWEVMDYFNVGGTKHDPERLRVRREKP